MMTQADDTRSQVSPEKQELSVEEQTPSDAEVGKDFTKQDVEAWAELHTRATHGKLRQQVAERDKWLGLAEYTRQQGEKATTELKQLREAEEQRLEQAASGDTDTFNLVQLRKEIATREVAISEQEGRVGWSELEHHELLERANALATLVEIGKIAQEAGISAEELFAANPESPEQAKVLAEKIAEIKAQAKPPPEAPKPPGSGLGTGGAKDLSGKTPMQLATEAYGK